MKILHDIHTHNVFSACCDDKTASTAAYLEKEASLGMKIFGLSNHLWDERVPGASSWYKNQPILKAEEAKHAFSLAAPGMRVLFGCETEYYACRDLLGMSAEGAEHFDYLLIPHSHLHMRNEVMSDFPEILEAREKVRALWMPYPENESDYYFLLDCIEKAEGAGTEVVLYKTGEPLHVFGDGEMTLYTSRLARSTQPVLLLTMDPDPATGRGGLLYCGSAVFESDLADAAAEAVSMADVVIFGNHGPLVKQPFGEDLTVSEHTAIVISAEGDVAAYLRTDATDLWLGQRRFLLP